MCSKSNTCRSNQNNRPAEPHQGWQCHHTQQILNANLVPPLTLHEGCVRSLLSPYLHTQASVCNTLSQTYLRAQKCLIPSDANVCIAIELRVNYSVMIETVILNELKVEAPQDISMPMCLKANFTLHASGTKPSQNLHFNRISPFTACFGICAPSVLLFHIFRPGCRIILCHIVFIEL